LRVDGRLRDDVARPRRRAGVRIVDADCAVRVDELLRLQVNPPSFEKTIRSSGVNGGTFGDTTEAIGRRESRARVRRLDAA
jgi:hypothetical protein